MVHALYISQEFCGVVVRCGFGIWISMWHGAVRSRATSGRSILFPLGHIEFEFVTTGNLLVARLILLLFVASWKGLRWVIEQPEGTAFPLQPRWQQFLESAHVSCHLFSVCFGQ